MTLFLALTFGLANGMTLPFILVQRKSQRYLYIGTGLLRFFISKRFEKKVNKRKGETRWQTYQMSITVFEDKERLLSKETSWQEYWCWRHRRLSRRLSTHTDTKECQNVRTHTNDIFPSALYKTVTVVLHTSVKDSLSFTNVCEFIYIMNIHESTIFIWIIKLLFYCMLISYIT